jgi:hypothetical protein
LCRVFEKHFTQTQTLPHSLPQQIRRLKVPAFTTNVRWGRIPAECPRKSGDDAVCVVIKFSVVWMGIQVRWACCLPFQTQGFNNCPVTVDIFELYIVEQSAASSDQHQQSSAGMMVLLMDLQMFGKIGDSVGQKSNLHFRRSRIGLVQFKFFDQLLLIF